MENKTTSNCDNFFQDSKNTHYQRILAASKKRTAMRRKITQFASFQLTRTGINIQHENDRWSTCRFLIIFTPYLVAALSISMVCVTNTDDLYTFATPTPYIAGSTTVLSGAYFMYCYRNLISEIIHKMDENFYTYPDEASIHTTYPWFLREENAKIFFNSIKYGMCVIILVICVPVAGEVAYYGRIRTFIYPSWTPWERDSLSIEAVTFMLQFYQVSCGMWMSYTEFIFLLVTVIEFTRQYHRLKAAVSSLAYRSYRTSVQQDDEGSFDQILRENIIHCIRHHQVLRKHFQMFKVWFSIFFSMELAISVTTFALALYTLLNAPSLAQVLSYLIVVLFVGISLRLIRCLISEIFSNLNDSLAKTVFWDVPWYKTNRENGILLVMFHFIACQPLRLYGLSIFEATRVTFGKIVRVTYSFFNVLNLSVKK